MRLTFPFQNIVVFVDHKAIQFFYSTFDVWKDNKHVHKPFPR